MISTSRCVSDVSQHIFMLKNALLNPQNCWHERKNKQIFKVNKVIQNITQIRYESHVSLRAHISI